MSLCGLQNGDSVLLRESFRRCCVYRVDWYKGYLLLVKVIRVEYTNVFVSSEVRKG